MQILSIPRKASDTGDGAILPTWTAVDVNNVRTQRELMENMRKDGWNVEVRFWPYFTQTVAEHYFSTTGMFTQRY